VSDRYLQAQKWSFRKSIFEQDCLRADCFWTMERQKKAFYNISRRVKVFDFAIIITDTDTVAHSSFSVPKTAIRSIHGRQFVSLSCDVIWRAGIAQSLQRLATGWTVRGSNPDGGEIFRTCPGRPLGPPSILYNGYRVFPWVKRLGRGVGHPPPPSAKVKERVEL